MRWFVRHERGRPPFVPQCTPEGDFHPWQSFAYCSMAGVSQRRRITKLHTLGQLATGSTDIPTDDGDDLGHLLFSLPWLGLKGRDIELTLRGRHATLPNLISKAVEAHAEGHFRVCRKFHLTEGLCRVAGTFGVAPSIRKSISDFHAGQVNQLVVMAAMSSALRKIRLGRRIDSELSDFREALAVGNLFENHLYYLGHLIELASFAHLSGFAFPKYLRAATNACLNEVSHWLGHYIDDIDISMNAHCLSHFRRGATLYMALAEANFSRTAIDGAILGQLRKRYLRQAAPITELRAKAFEQFQTAPPQVTGRPRLEAIVSTYNSGRGAFPPAQGSYPHFRKVLIPKWPRAVHFEFLDYRNAIGVELHLESELVRALHGPICAALASSGRANWRWDGGWSNGRGRVTCVISDDVEIAEAVNEMKSMIAFFRRTLQSKIKLTTRLH
jgi:hypothetical protein